MDVSLVIVSPTYMSAACFESKNSENGDRGLVQVLDRVHCQSPWNPAQDMGVV